MNTTSKIHKTFVFILEIARPNSLVPRLDLLMSSCTLSWIVKPPTDVAILQEVSTYLKYFEIQMCKFLLTCPRNLRDITLPFYKVDLKNLKTLKKHWWGLTCTCWFLVMYKRRSHLRHWRGMSKVPVSSINFSLGGNFESHAQPAASECFHSHTIISSPLPFPSLH